MSEQVKQLAQNVAEFMAMDPPAMLSGESPALVPEALLQSNELYLIGLIGGKEVGKSAIVNALVGQKITDETSFGRGTSRAIVYVHQSRKDEIYRLLNGLIPGEFDIFPHEIPGLQNQALLDLPDIDSRFSQHVHLVRCVLRHLLYPIWVTSIEKYADLVPHQVLQQVAEGNSPDNFLFVLNKCDQLEKQSLRELSEDHSRRLSKLLGMQAPRIWCVSTRDATRFDLADLRAHVMKSRDRDTVMQSKQHANARQDQTLLRWVDSSGLEQHTHQLENLIEDSNESLAVSVVSPLLEEIVEPLCDDPGYRLALVDEAFANRVKHWPILGAMNVLFSPVLAIIRRNLSAGESTGERDLVCAYFNRTSRTIDSLLAGVFARLKQQHPHVTNVWGDRQLQLWDSMLAQSAAGNLRDQLAGAMQEQRDSIVQSCNSKFDWIFSPWRVLLTIGAVLWFPIIQPVLAMAWPADGFSWTMLGRSLVTILSAGFLLQQVSFLFIWFLSIWIILRWLTHNQIARRLRNADQSLLHATAIKWAKSLVEPLESRAASGRSLLEQANLMSKNNSA